jgi:hypothetical protein
MRRPLNLNDNLITIFDADALQSTTIIGLINQYNRNNIYTLTNETDFLIFNEQKVIHYV